MAQETHTPLAISHSDGSQNQIQVFAAADPSAPLVFISPAMGVRASYYAPLAQAFAEQGIHACTLDYRGTGNSSVRASRKVDFGYEVLVMDLKEAVGQLRKEFPDNRFILLGHSLGGQIGALAMSRFPDLFDGLALIAACMVYYKGWEGKGTGRIQFAVRFFPFLAKVWGYFPGKKVGFGGREARTVMKDWGLNGTQGIYRPKGSTFDYEEALRQFAAPVLALSLAGDSFAPQKAVANLVAKVDNSPNHQHLHITADQAGLKKLTHFNWVKHPNFFVKQVKAWAERL